MSNDSFTSPASYPWDEDDAPLQQRVAAGPIVRTERLYRSASFEDKSIADSPLPEREPLPPFSDSNSAAMLDPVATATRSSSFDDQYAPRDDQVSDHRAPEHGLNTLGVVLLIGGITTVVGFLDMTLHRQFTWWAGAAFIIGCFLAAIMVRPRDLWVAVIAAPLCYVGALIIAGQPSTLDGSGSLLVRELNLIATGLAFNAPYIFGGTILALLVVLFRRVKIGKTA